MRVIKFFFRSVVILTMVGAVVGLGAREILLSLGVSQIKSSLSSMRKANAQRSYLEACRQKGSGSPTSTIQLRFISDTEYLYEVVCGQFSLDPIVIETKNLPFLVQKKPGSSGIIWGNNLSGITLEIFGRSKSIWVESEDIFQSSEMVELGFGPISSCSGYGFNCCQIASQAGTGEQLQGVNDCPRSCFSACMSRPVLLSLSSQPFADRNTRILTVKSGELVDFSYVVDKGEAESIQVTLEYGDGEKDLFTQTNDQSNHSYLCQTVRCEYLLKLSVVDNNGVEASDSQLNRMRIVVTR